MFAVHHRIDFALYILDSYHQPNYTYDCSSTYRSVEDTGYGGKIHYNQNYVSNSSDSAVLF